MELDMKIKILGNEWKIRMSSYDEEPRLSNCDGFTDWTETYICIQNPYKVETNLGDPIKRVKKIARHEILHAFMYESGLGDNWEHEKIGQEETTVDWLAIQFNKIKDVIFDVEKAIDEAVKSDD